MRMSEKIGAAEIHPQWDAFVQKHPSLFRKFLPLWRLRYSAETIVRVHSPIE